MNLRAMCGLLVALTVVMSSVLVPALPFGMGEETNVPKAIDAAWPMFGKDTIHSSAQANPIKGIMDPFLLWDKGTVDCWGSNIGDMRKNIVLENVSTYTRPGLHGVYSRGNTVQVIEGLSGNVMWAVAMGADIQAATAITDTDQDQKVEIAIATTNGNVSVFEPTIRWNGTAYRFNQSSTQSDRVWSHNLGESVTYSSIALGDITGDGLDDVLLSTQTRAIALNGTSGQRLWNYTLGGVIASTPAIFKWGTSAKRIAVSSYNITSLRLSVTMLDSTGHHLWNDSYIMSLGTAVQVPLILPSVSGGDIDNDGAKEVILATLFETGDGQVRAYELDGTPISGWTAPFQASGMIETTPAVADLNKDGMDDIVIASWNVFGLPQDSEGHIYAINGSDGTELWNAVLNRFTNNITNDRIIASPLITDLDKDGTPDVVVPSYNGRVYALNGKNGSELWTLDPSVPHLALYSSPCAADMDGNGILEIFVDGMLITHRIAELSISEGDISFDYPSPTVGDQIHISALIYNSGTRPVNDVTVRFDDIYDMTTTTIGYDTINITQGGTAEASLDYMVQGGGEHKAVVIVDPDNKVDELNKNDNRASKKYSVASQYSLVLTVTNSTIIVDPGQQATYTIKVKNTGEQPNTIQLAVSSAIPNGWSTAFTMELVTLDSKEEQSIGLIVSTSASSLAGLYTINVTGTSTNEPASHNTTQVVTALRGEYGVLLTCEKAEKNVNSEGFARFDFNISNIGNSEDDIQLYNSSPMNSSWLVFLSEPGANIPARGYKMAALTVKPPTSGNVGDSETISVLAVSSGDPAQSDALVFTTTIVAPDFVVLGMSFQRNDGTAVDGATKHIIANRTTKVNLTVANILGNIDYLQGVYLELYIDNNVAGQAFIDIYGDIAPSVIVATSFKVGPHKVMACFEASHFIQEVDETNNCLETQISAKSDTTVGPYKVFGTIFWPTGQKLAKADVKVTNLRTMEYFAMKTDNLGNYSMDLMDLPSEYLEEEHISVNASNGVTVREAMFYAYSEDGSKHLDIIMFPQPYDFFIGPQVKVSAEPGKAAVFAMTVTQLGNATNNITLSLTGRPSGWEAQVLDKFTEPVQNIIVGKDQSSNFSVRITPALDARANEAGEILTLTGTSQPQPEKEYAVALIVGVLQIYKINFTNTGGQALKGKTASFNLSVSNEGNGDEVVTPSVSNNSQGWPVRLGTSKLNLTYKATKDIRIETDVPQDAETGTYTLVISLSYGSGQRLDVPLKINVLEYDYSIQVRNNDMSSRDIIPGKSESFSFAVLNKGNVNNSVNLIVVSVPEGWTATLTDLAGTTVSSVSIPIGQSKALILKVDAPAQTMGIKNVVINVTGISTYSPAARSSAFALLSVSAADLVPVGNVTFSKKSLTAGQEVQITVEVRNLGTVAASGAFAVFLVDNKVLRTIPIDLIEKGMTTPVSIDWTPKAGTHTITVRINPNQTIVEMNYENNNIQTTVQVKEKGLSLSFEGMLMIGIVIILVVVAIGYFIMTRMAKKTRRSARKEEEPEEDYEEGEEEEEASEEDDPEESSEEEEYEDEEPPEEEEEEVHEAEVVEEPKPNIKRIGSGKKVARPMSHYENFNENEEPDIDLDDEDNSGNIIRFR